MKYGPVDVVILALGEPKFDGSILSELEKLVQTGTIRVLDAMVVVKDAEGTVSGIDIEDLPDEDKSRLGFIETGTRGLFDFEDFVMRCLDDDGPIRALVASPNFWCGKNVDCLGSIGGNSNHGSSRCAPPAAACRRNRS